MFSVQVTTEDKGALQTLDIMSNNIKNKNVVLVNIGMLMMGSITKNFKDEGRPDKWRKLSDETLRQRRHGKKKSLGTRILQDTGTLKNSIMYTISNDLMTLAPSVNYGKYHQMGWGVPKRPFMMFQKEDETRIKDIIEKFLTQGIA